MRCALLGLTVLLAVTGCATAPTPQPASVQLTVEGRKLADAAELQDQIAVAEAAGVSVGSIVTAGWLLVLALGLGIAGGVLALLRKGRIAAPVLLVAAIAPAVFEPKSLVFSFLLIVAGLLALGATPRPAMAGRLGTA